LARLVVGSKLDFEDVRDALCHIMRTFGYEVGREDVLIEVGVITAKKVKSAAAGGK